jgi:hypothetical protein
MPFAEFDKDLRVHLLAVSTDLRYRCPQSQQEYHRHAQREEAIGLWLAA